MDIMQILTNWLFWVVLAAIVFVFAIIGFFAESKKKHTKQKEETKKENMDVQIANAAPKEPVKMSETIVTPQQNQVSLDSFSEIPEVPVKNMEINDQQNNTSEMFNKPVNTPVEPVATNQVQNVESVNVETPVLTKPQESIQPSQQTGNEENLNLPPIDQQTTEEAATLFNNDDDSDVWKV